MSDATPAELRAEITRLRAILALVNASLADDPQPDLPDEWQPTT